MSLRAILMYHSIDDSGSVISVPPAVFGEHVHWMVHSGIRVVPLAQLIGMAPGHDAGAIALTFDDGFANFAGTAKVLEEHGLPATVFVVTGHVGQTNEWGGRAQPDIPTLPLLDWESLGHLSERGMTVGAHTHTHAALTTLPAGAAAEEMDRCTAEIQQRLGARPSSLAYPYGAVDARVASLAGARFAAAVTTRFAALAGDEPRTAIPRLDMYYFRRAGAIHRLADGGFDWWVNWVRFRRQARQVFGSRLAPAGAIK